MVNKSGIPVYDYEIKDHLGNVRATITKSLTGDSVEVLSYSDYYPHGGALPGRGYVNGSNPRYNCYQGENAERDDETQLINFDLRMYDPEIARWSSPDPMHQDYSPYLAMGNNPIGNIDPTGGSWVHKELDQLGQWTKNELDQFGQWAKDHKKSLESIGVVAVAVIATVASYVVC